MARYRISVNMEFVRSSDKSFTWGVQKAAEQLRDDGFFSPETAARYVAEAKKADLQPKTATQQPR